MNEETQNLINSKITELLSWLEEAGKTGSSFVVEQTPLYIQELLAWNFWYSLMWFIFGVGLWVVASLFTIPAFKADWDYDNKDFGKKMCIFPALICFMIGLFIWPENFTWLQIKLAPRVWLVEYLQGMIQ